MVPCGKLVRDPAADAMGNLRRLEGGDERGPRHGLPQTVSARWKRSAVLVPPRAPWAVLGAEPAFGGIKPMSVFDL